MRFLAPLLLLALAAATGCGRTESRAAEVGFGLLAASPASVKANHHGAVTLSGRGFTSHTRVLVEGVAIEEVLPATVELVDSETLLLHLEYAGAGAEHPVGDYELGVVDAARIGTTVGFRVRPFLGSLEHVRTLPGDVSLDGGTFVTWLRPSDHLGALVRPGHEIVGEIGMLAAHFVSEDVQLVAADSTVTLSSLRTIGDVEFDPVNDAKPLAVSIAIDQSGSMISPAPGSDPDDERVNQSQAFVDRLNGTSTARVTRFSGGSGGVSVVVDWTGDKTALHAGLDTLRTGEGGNTPLYDAMIDALNAVATRSTENLRAAIVLTDGLDTSSSATPAEVIDLGRSLGIPVFAIGLGNPATPGSIDQATLSEISVQTGGLFYFAEDSAALESVFESLSEVLRSSYRVEVGFTVDPPLTAAGTYAVHGKVRATVDGEDAIVQVPGFTASVTE